MIHAPIVIQKAGSPMIGTRQDRTFRCGWYSTPQSLLQCWNWGPSIHLVLNFFMWPISCWHYWSPNLHWSEITSSVGCVLCVPLPIRGGCRLQTLQYPLSDGSQWDAA